VAKIERFRETLTRARPDVLVMIGSDHFHQFWLDNLPQFLVGKAPFFDGNFYNEEREFGLPRMTLRGHEDLAAHILRDGLDRNFDLAFSNELRIDHSITCPIITLRPQADLPIVPIYTNIFAPPMPQPRRFVELGYTIRELVESWPSDLRVAIVGTGHLSLELGGPRQFGSHGPDPEFDRKAVEWIATGDLKGCLAEVTLDSLHAPGNATHGFMDFMLMMGVAGEGFTADHVDTLDLFHTMEAYFTWYPKGGIG
jgi:protocatechuate 4,5-dioxygenase, beta chain